MKPPLEQREVIQPQLHFAGGERGPVGIFGFTEADIFRDEAVDEAEAHPGKFQRHVVFPQRGHEPRF